MIMGWSRILAPLSGAAWSVVRKNERVAKM